MKNLSSSTGRLDVVDALRGLALLAIVLLHNLEHYNIYFTPEWQPVWLQTLDRWLWDGTFFLMAGKAYATFSLLFGFSFYIQLRNARARGEDFRARFAWRLLLLVGFSQLHALFYNGDILLLYAVVGLILIPASSLSDRTVLLLAGVMMLQPLDLGRIIYASHNSDYVYLADGFMKYSAAAKEVSIHGSYGELLCNNIWNGQWYSNTWQVEAGRLFQTGALFLLGMLLGRRELFVSSDNSRRIWLNVLYTCIVLFPALWIIRTWLPEQIGNPTIRVACTTLFATWTNVAMMAMMVSAFTLWWFRIGNGSTLQRVTVFYGRMTLTNYITQSIVGVAIYYGCGLGLYKYTGATITLLIGTAIVCAQLLFSRWWLSRHRNGPLEWLWRKGTWIGSHRS